LSKILYFFPIFILSKFTWISLVGSKLSNKKKFIIKSARNENEYWLKLSFYSLIPKVITWFFVKNFYFYFANINKKIIIKCAKILPQISLKLQKWKKNEYWLKLSFYSAPSLGTEASSSQKKALIPKNTSKFEKNSTDFFCQFFFIFILSQLLCLYYSLVGLKLTSKKNCTIKSGKILFRNQSQKKALVPEALEDMQWVSEWVIEWVRERERLSGSDWVSEWLSETEW